MLEHFYILEFKDGQKREFGPFANSRIAQKHGARTVRKLERKGAKVTKLWVRRENTNHRKIMLHLFNGYPERWDNVETFFYLEDLRDIDNRATEELDSIPERLVILMCCSDHPKTAVSVSALPGKPYLVVACGECQKPLFFAMLAPKPEPKNEQE